MVRHKTEPIYRRYAIVDEAMMQSAGERLNVLHGQQAKVRRRRRRTAVWRDETELSKHLSNTPALGHSCCRHRGLKPISVNREPVRSSFSSQIPKWQSVDVLFLAIRFSN